MADKEYIERGAVENVIRRLYAEPTYQHKGENYYVGVTTVDQEIAGVPTANVVEVVRCKDCVYWEGRGYDGRCEAPHNGLIREYSNYDDFCSYGERRTDNDVV